MTLNNALGKIAMLLIASGACAPLLAEECTDDPKEAAFSAKLERNFQERKKNVDLKLDWSTDIKDHPLAYKNPDAGCDLGFEMPGLPSIGFGLGGLDACKAVKAVTGEHIKQLSRDMQDAVDQGLDSITGGDTSFDIDLGEMAVDELQGL